MKRLMIISIFCGFANLTFSQNFGIDQPNPTEKLDVNGNAKVGTLHGPYVIYGRLGSFDTRDDNENPEVYRMGITSEFKRGSAIGLVDGGTYNSVLSIRQWSSGTDWSGGGVHQLGFTPNGSMYHRYSQTTGSWGSWAKVISSNDVANFFGNLANASTIVSGNSGYARFSAVQNTDANVFEVISSGNFGVRIKMAGTIMWNYDQDIITSGGNYSYVFARIDGSNVGYSLIAPTSGKWDGFHIGGCYSVVANQVLTFLWGSSGSDITAMDNGMWGHLSILWIGQ